jgi:hypothetical protein
MSKREAELEEPGALSSGGAVRSRSTLADAIDRYIETSRKDFGRKKAQVLRYIENHPIGAHRREDISSRDVVNLAERIGLTAKPQTVLNYMSHLSSIFAIARPAWGIPLEQQAMADAQKVMKRLVLNSKSKERDRRPTNLRSSSYQTLRCTPERASASGLSRSLAP